MAPDENLAPAPPHAKVKQRIAQAILDARPEIIALSHEIHANPEVAFEERASAALTAEALRRHGYEVEHPAGTLATAIRARLSGGRGSDGPRVAVLAEYDALPGLGHGCGHNTMAAAGVGAAIGLAAAARDVDGEILILGTPAEEYGSGKQTMLDDGLFDGVDAAIQFHPSDITDSRCRLLALQDVEVEFVGRAAHAAGEPWMGRNALDALVLLFVSIGLWRQQLRPDARVHGIVVEGGAAANIVPARARARFMIRSPRESELGEMRERFRAMVDAAALATGCDGRVTFSGLSRTMRDNDVLRERFVANLAAYGQADGRSPDDSMGSSDMGNVSHVLPTIHPHIAICAEGVPSHSPQFRDAAVSERADEVTLLAAIVTAQTAYEVLADPSLAEAAWSEFRSTKEEPSHG